jgi:hypothetical protein
VFDRTSLAQTIVDRVAPVLGQMMAESSIDLHCRRLKIDGPLVTREQAEALLAKLAMGMTVFVGREKVDVIIQEIRLALRIPSV